MHVIASNLFTFGCSFLWFTNILSLCWLELFRLLSYTNKYVCIFRLKIDSYILTCCCSCSLFSFFSLFYRTAEIKTVHVGWLTVSTAASGSWWSCTAPVRGGGKENHLSGCKINSSKVSGLQVKIWPDIPGRIWQLWQIFLKNCSISEWLDTSGQQTIPAALCQSLTLCKSIHQSSTAWLTKPLTAERRRPSMERPLNRSVNK